MTVRPSVIALTPLLLFLALFFGAGLYYTGQGDAMGFYRLHAPVAILPAVALGLWIARRAGVKAMDTLLQGIGDANIVLMCLIFLLAGAFAMVTKQIGAVDAVVALGVGALPPALILPGLFLVAGFLSLAVGTSMGTIAAITPIALGVSDAAGIDRALVVGAVIGGATFGDNLSVISDTAIAAARTQGCTVREKFRENIKIALPAALLTLVLLAVVGDASPVETAEPTSPWLVLPYVLVLLLAITGLDVLIVLTIGLVVAGLFGVWFAPQDYGLPNFTDDIYAGFESVVEITLLALFVGGLGALMKASGGLHWLAGQISRIARGNTGRRAGEWCIAALAALTDVFTANNTVAILISGGVARDIAERHGVPPARAASVLDIFVCIVQSLLPYGAQILLAASLAGLSPLVLMGKAHYCWLLAAVTVLFMVWPSRKAKAVKAEGA
ncbi:Na+/H+ antiporter NhaC family protein [Pseudoxanthomonas sp. SL93]|uniref:Na+/H+ antiporter NhaC family protein n=1 Tax=Pseudoxanthomonas sp. SL93 TaxID=2995142 RepID=UPI00226FFBAB|nr:Na+/H+ antiporter NhaC family protein [Pseudoxanthomonas sp. SL93]WAC64508.1 Na+/H+ antiporter NhaC family protein [Pseudoxanthomonas sp. SL93]